MELTDTQIGTKKTVARLLPTTVDNCGGEKFYAFIRFAYVCMYVCMRRTQSEAELIFGMVLIETFLQRYKKKLK